MPTLETLSVHGISGLFSKSAFSKARNYKSRVASPVRKGNQLSATVMGRRMYKVEVMVDALGIHAACTCPYEWAGHCKHIGALLLCWIESPHLFRTEPAGETQVIAGLEVFAAEIAPPTAPKALPVWLAESFADRQARAHGHLTRLLELDTVAA